MQYALFNAFKLMVVPSWILVTQQIKSLDLQQGKLVGKLGRRLPPSGATTIQTSLNDNVKMWLGDSNGEEYGVP